MLGIIIAAIIGLWKYFFTATVFEVIFVSLMNFLFWWYIVTSSILMAIVFLVMLGVTGTAMVGGAGMGNSAGGKIIGGLLGLAGGAGISVLMAAVSLIRCALLIGGAHLLSTAVALSGKVYVWDTKTLIFGSVAILLGLVLSSSNSSSSKSS